uniref:REPAT3 n=1 Tax=Spodoptera littoralis TaxID=7109 RepID=I0B5X4_SPOLI|nr:REPAT3 [Spodoptera littoralis]
MRSFIIITVLSALAACYGAAVLPSEDEMVTIIYDDKSPNGIIMSRADFDARSQGWVLLSEANDLIPAVEGQVQSIRMVYRA